MSLLVEPGTETAKEFMLLNSKLTEGEHIILNRLGRYDLEVIAIKVLTSFFGDFGESSMGKTTTFLDQLVRNIHFNIDVGSGRRERRYKLFRGKMRASCCSIS